MKFLVDENLPLRLAVWLQDRGFEATHDVRVLHLGIGNGTTTRLLEWITPLLADAVARLSAGERYVRLD